MRLRSPRQSRRLRRVCLYALPAIVSSGVIFCGDSLIVLDTSVERVQRQLYEAKVVIRR